MADKPNILLLFTDMQRHDTIGALGNPQIKTPNLDRLVAEGTAFTNCYTPSPVCVSARCSMHYGLYPQKTKTYGNAAMMEDNGRSYVQRLSEAGYKTLGIGKKHFTPDPYAMRGYQQRLLQEEMTSKPEKDDYLRDLWDAGFDYICDPHGVRGEMYYIPQVAQMPAAHHPTQWIGDRSIDFIREQENSDQPWYLYSSFIHPHPPFAPPNPWHKLYRSFEMSLPRVPADRDAHLTYANKVQNRYKYRDRGIDINLLRQIKAYYYACISFVDYQVGRIMDSLEESGQLDNTLIVFSSDHGEHLGDYHCFGKRSMHDSSSRVPMIARLPGTFAAGEVCEDVVSLVDVGPTFTTIGGADATDFDGLPLQDVAAAKTDREYVYSQWDEGPYAEYLIASKDWSYFYSAPDAREYCYHKAVDPHQQQLVAASAPFKRKDVQKLRDELLAYLKESGEEKAYEEKDGKLVWRSYPTSDIPVGPDERLLVQDHSWADFTLPGYTD